MALRNISSVVVVFLKPGRMLPRGCLAIIEPFIAEVDFGLTIVNVCYRGAGAFADIIIDAIYWYREF